MEKNKLGLDEANLIAIGIATALFLPLIDINLEGTLERVLYFLGIPIAVVYFFHIYGKDINEPTNNSIGNVLKYIIGALVIALFVNGSLIEKKTIKACKNGNQDACEAIEYAREQREDYGN